MPTGTVAYVYKGTRHMTADVRGRIRTAELEGEEIRAAIGPDDPHATSAASTTSPTR